jgi:glycosyltransferase involved in cell wall biosynthesis
VSVAERIHPKIETAQPSVALVCLRGAINLASWLGNAGAIERGLAARGHSVERLDVEREAFSLPYKAKQFAMTRLLRHGYSRHREPAMLGHYGRVIGESLDVSKPDVVLALTAMPVAQLDCDAPIVMWNDTPFAGMLDFYPGFKNMTAASIRDGHAMERAAHERADLILYSSRWAAELALDFYRVPEAKIRILGFGANVESGRTVEENARAAREKSALPLCRLLWIGVEWERKGGPTALAVAAHLQEMGVTVELVLAGCRPPTGVALPAYVRSLGFVSRDQIATHLTAAHFVLIPSLADCSPIAFAEASAFGVPSLGTRVGGIPEVILDGRNGRAFECSDPPEAYARYVATVLGESGGYERLSRSTFAEFRERLNWGTVLDAASRYLGDVR